MPANCAAYRCTQRRTVESRQLGITFHRFPRNHEERKKWEIALRRVGFAASDESVLCSKHFKPEDFDRTGMICRIKPSVIPSVFDFPAHLRKSAATRTTKNSSRAKESLPLQGSQVASKEEPQPNVDLDHNYTLPSSLSALKAKYSGAAARVLSLEREKRNAQMREKRATTTLKALLKDLKEKNLLNEELYESFT